MADLGIRLDARNPGEFLAGCGVLQIAAHAAPGTLCSWSEEYDYLALQHSAAEAELVAQVQALAKAAADLPEHAEPPDPLTLADHRISWWIGGVESRSGKWSWASSWREGKFWSGQQTLASMLVELGTAAAELGLEHLSDITEPHSSSRLRASLRYDTLTQPTVNQLGRPANVAAKPRIRPWLELLALVGRSWFAPGSRPRIANGGSTAGFLQHGVEAFSYRVWREPLPSSLARVACLPGAPVRGTTFKSSVVPAGKTRVLSAAVVFRDREAP